MTDLGAGLALLTQALLAKHTSFLRVCSPLLIPPWPASMSTVVSDIQLHDIAEGKMECILEGVEKPGVEEPHTPS